MAFSALMAKTKRFAQLPGRSQAYISVVVVVGAFTVFEAVYGLVSQDTGWRWLVLAVLTFLEWLRNTQTALSSCNNLGFRNVWFFHFCPSVWRIGGNVDRCARCVRNIVLVIPPR